MCDAIELNSCLMLILDFSNMTKELKQRQAVRGGLKAYMTSVTARATAMITCTYCLQSHASVNCQVFNTVQARKEVLKHNGNCLYAFGRGTAIATAIQEQSVVSAKTTIIPVSVTS